MSAERRFAADDAGATALEFAIIAPVLISLVFGVFQLGWAMHCGSSARYAVEAAARQVMLHPSLSQAAVQAQVEDTLDRVHASGEVEVSLTYDTSNPAQRIARVGAVYRHRVAVPFTPGWIMVYRPVASAPA